MYLAKLTPQNQLFTGGDSNAGNHYTSGTVAITGSGLNAAANLKEFRDNGIMEVRVVDPGDSSIAGGAGYTFVNNRAQLGAQRGAPADPFDQLGGGPTD